MQHAGEILDEVIDRWKNGASVVSLVYENPPSFSYARNEFYKRVGQEIARTMPHPHIRLSLRESRFEGLYLPLIVYALQRENLLAVYDIS